MFRKDEMNLVQHLESIADQILDFGCEANIKTRGFLPQIELKPDNYVMGNWQTPYMRRIKLLMKNLVTKINESQTMHQMRKQLKMDEDPWDNYLVYDSKYFLPLLCHSAELKIEE